MKTKISTFLFALVVATTNIFGQNKPIKNIIIMIPDGTSIDVLALARWYNNSVPLAIDPYIRGLVKTHCSDTPIGDSAPTGSTYATGHLSRTGFVATYPDSVMQGMEIIATDPIKAFSPMFTIMESAKLMGKSTGLIVTCHFPHATPADFSSHSQNRDNYELLSKQMVFNNIDLVLGGGYNYIDPKKRNDKLDLTKLLIYRGYTLLKTPAELQSFNGLKAWGLFAPESLKNEMDRDPQAQPTLAEMTQKGIELLSKNENGFFMMVEGSKVDWSAHDNDPIGMVTEFLAFDKAVKIALDFAKTDGKTLVIIVPDHGNSGISIGNSKSNKTYDEITLKQLIGPLKAAKLTADAITELIDSNSTSEQIREVFAAQYGVNDLTANEIDTLQSYFRYKSMMKQGKLKRNPVVIQKLTATIITKRTYLGFTTYGHTGEDVFFAAYDPRNMAPTGLILNNQVNEFMQQTWNTNLDSLTNLFFAPHTEVFSGFNYSIDSTDRMNKVLMVKTQKTILRIPENQNFVFVNGIEKQYPTIMVYNGIRFYVPKSLRMLLK